MVRSEGLDLFFSFLEPTGLAWLGNQKTLSVFFLFISLLSFSVYNNTSNIVKQIKETRTNEFVKKKIDIISRKIEALSMEIQFITKRRERERERERVSLFV